MKTLITIAALGAVLGLSACGVTAAPEVHNTTTTALPAAPAAADSAGQLRASFTDHAQAPLTVLEHNLSALSHDAQDPAVQAGDFSAVQSDCQAMQVDVEQATAAIIHGSKDTEKMTADVQALG